MDTIKRAVILAAGEGKRLRPVTLEVPKPLIRVNGKRIMDTSIHALRANGIRDIYVVVGYKKEMFYKIYGRDPDIHMIENPEYLMGNNITSMYAARRYLPEAFVIEADIMIRNEEIFYRNIEKSGYMASWMEPALEWVSTVEQGRLIKCEKDAQRIGYQLWGISMWNRCDGEMLAEEIRHTVEDKNIRSIFWDEVALNRLSDRYDLGIREIRKEDIREIDTFDELVQIDESYKKYKNI